MDDYANKKATLYAELGIENAYTRQAEEYEQQAGRKHCSVCPGWSYAIATVEDEPLCFGHVLERAGVETRTFTVYVNESSELVGDENDSEHIVADRALKQTDLTYKLEG